MKRFTDMLTAGSPEAKRKEMKLRYDLASACLAEFPTSESPGHALYSAFSHLSMIPELEINIAQFDNIMFATTDVIDRSLYTQALAKLKELEDLLNADF